MEEDAQLRSVRREEKGDYWIYSEQEPCPVYLCNLNTILVYKYQIKTRREKEGEREGGGKRGKRDGKREREGEGG